MAEWYERLVAARTRLNVSQTELAVRASVSLSSIKAYERGVRHPSRPHLAAVLDALKLDRAERHDIFVAAGYALDAERLGPAWNDLGLSREGAERECRRAVWPVFVLGEFGELVCANDILLKLWGVDLSTEFTGPGERSLLAVATNPRFADRVLNWDDAVGALASVFKGHHRGPEDLEQPSPVFKSMLDRLLAGDPAYVRRFLDLWQRVEPATPRLRWHYPMAWQHPAAGVMRFDCVVSTCNADEGQAFNDWIPVDSESWANLERLRSLQAST
jgi:transcriptional regulator with XRE-family HTH domain